mmetsp:Transcript_22943/g.36025  ORF Transcript_22943/g.36025 Transcript_22943/m.36025 type:complete len:99 (+) Transcript_22943:2-298(+)
MVSISVSHSFTRESSSEPFGNMIGRLMQEAQSKILDRVVEHQCNACLGMSFDMTNESSGEGGDEKEFVVTAQGTPCVVVPTTRARVVDVSAITELVCE